jgi:uncharacterized membrane protein
MDELVTYYLVSDKSLLHMMYAIADQVDSSPPFYHIILHLWSIIFGSSELTLRLFSSFMMAGSLFVLYRILQKIFGIYEAVIGLIVIYFINSFIFNQNSEARYYALLLFEFNVLLLLHLEIIFNYKKYYILLALVQVTFILTHPFGILYSFGLMISSLIYFYITKINYHLIISTLVSWLLSLIYLPVFLNQIKVGEPHFWITSPSLANGIRTILIDIVIVPKWIILIISFIGFICFINIMISMIYAKIKNNSVNRYNDQKIFIYLLSFILLVIPMIVFVYSIVITPIFVKRYMIISEIAWGIIISAIINNYKNIVVKKYDLTKYKYIIQLILIGTLLIPIAQSFHYKDTNRNEIVEDLKNTKTNEYMVLLSPHKYLPRYYYSTHKASFLFVIDDEITQLPDNISNALVDYKLMNALKRNYPLHNIVSNSYLMDSLSLFKVRNENDRLWFYKRIVDNPNYEYHEIYKNVYDVKLKNSITRNSKRLL